MSSSREARELAKLLRKLADWVETHPGLFQDNSRQKLGNRFEPFKILADEGEESLRSQLLRLTTAQLQILIKTNRLDPSGQTRDWKDKTDLADFAYDRLRNKWTHGNVFEQDEARKAN